MKRQTWTHPLQNDGLMCLNALLFNLFIKQMKMLPQRSNQISQMLLMYHDQFSTFSAVSLWPDNVLSVNYFFPWTEDHVVYDIILYYLQGRGSTAIMVYEPWLLQHFRLDRSWIPPAIVVYVDCIWLVSGYVHGTITQFRFIIYVMFFIITWSYYRVQTK